jgi:Putative beta-barrel porin-2, OmpL-like. bbp2
MGFRRALPGAVLTIGFLAVPTGGWAQAPVAAVQEPAPTAPSSDQQPVPIAAGDWKFGGFLDAAYIKNFNSPSNHLFRSRGTTPRVDELTINMGGVYLRKDKSDSSPCGLELTAHAGEDSKTFGFSATAPNISGANWLRHLGPTNLSCVAPLGNGLTLQGGIFSSFVGYDSLYPKDNFTYTRPWTADFTPYLMLGVSAGYPINDKVTLTALVVNGYWHLAHANDIPSVGGQLAYKPTERVTMKQTVLYGPHQGNTSLKFWRVLSDTIVERKTDLVTAAFEFQVSTEVVDAARRSRALWVAAQAPVHVTVRGPWSATVRPEVAWDRDGRWTTFEQWVRAITTTLEYRARFGQPQAIFRLEHRYDNSNGAGGGFYKDVEPGVLGLTPGQHLLVFGWILTFDKPSR